MPRPLVVVVSGKTQMILPGFCSVRCLRVTSFFGSVGEREGGEKASLMAEKRVMRSTRRVWGYERVKMGWKMPAKYSGSSGLVNELAMMEPARGRWSPEV